MISGTFQEWVDDGCHGIFAAGEFDKHGHQPDVRIVYTVDPWDGFVGYDVWSCTLTPFAYPERVKTVAEAVERGWLTWDTHGEVEGG